MPEFKTKEEYEKWKEERLKSPPEKKSPDATKQPAFLKNKRLTIVIILILFGIAGLIFSLIPEIPKTQTDVRKAQIEKHFSSWDGSHRTLTEVIKKSMHDPSSYKHVETKYRDMGDYLIVTTEFRGKNAFGAVVKNSVIAKVDLDGNVISIISQEP